MRKRKPGRPRLPPCPVDAGVVRSAADLLGPEHRRWEFQQAIESSDPDLRAVFAAEIAETIDAGWALQPEELALTSSILREFSAAGADPSKRKRKEHASAQQRDGLALIAYEVLRDQGLTATEALNALAEKLGMEPDTLKRRLAEQRRKRRQRDEG
ncbi:MAG: hypothetical protein WED00_08460 [Aquisalimonadaceae bacterium]